MLILTRRLGEEIIVSDNISFIVLGIKGCQVRLGINAPKEIPVHRKEVYLRNKRAEKERMESEKNT